MRLINAYDLKQLLLEERAQVPDGRFGDAVRCGIRMALRCMERCVPVEIVYCKDCKHCSFGSCEHPRHHGVLPSAYPFDFYNYGVNKHGN